MQYEPQEPRPLLDFTDFRAWFEDLNRERPPYKMNAEQLAAQAGWWFRDLRGVTKFALEDMLRRWLRDQHTRPQLSHVVAGAREYMRGMLLKDDVRAKQLGIGPDANHCSCNCGGERWCYVLFDVAGQPRRFPSQVDALGIPPTLSERARIGVVAEIAALAGDFITRDSVECRRAKTEVPPRDGGELLGKDSRGLMVWSHRRLTLAAAA